MQGRDPQGSNDNQAVATVHPPVLSQGMLLKHINLYLKELKRPLWDDKGYCHGLNVVWQQKMADYNEEQFYAVIEKIINQPTDKLKELDEDIDVQKFLAQVEFAQNINQYGYGRRIQQRDVDSIMETPDKLYWCTYFSNKSFAKLLDNHVKENTSVTVMSHTIYKHSIGIYFRDGKYYLYDANYINGRAKIFDTSTEAAEEMSKCLYDNFRLNRQQWRTQEVIMVNPVPSPVYVKKNGSTFQTITLFLPVVIYEPVVTTSEVVLSERHKNRNFSTK